MPAMMFRLRPVLADTISVWIAVLLFVLGWLAFYIRAEVFVNSVCARGIRDDSNFCAWELLCLVFLTVKFADPNFCALKSLRFQFLRLDISTLSTSTRRMCNIPNFRAHESLRFHRPRVEFRY